MALETLNKSRQYDKHFQQSIKGCSVFKTSLWIHFLNGPQVIGLALFTVIKASGFALSNEHVNTLHASTLHAINDANKPALARHADRHAW